LDVLETPRLSPDLSVLDYAIWSKATAVFMLFDCYATAAAVKVHVVRTDFIHTTLRQQALAQGLWMPRAHEALTLNGICVDGFCKDVLVLLRDGRRPDVPVWLPSLAVWR